MYFDPPPVGTVGAGIAGSFGKYLGDGLSIGPSTFSEAGSVVTASGDFRFSGTVSPGLRLKSLTTTQRDATTGGAGDLIYNSTTDRVNLYRAAGWVGGWVRLEGDSMSGPLVIAGGTVTANAPILDLSQTWNNPAVAFEGIKLNITDTASAQTSYLIRFLVGGSERFSLTKAGTFTIAGALGFGGGNTYLIADTSNTLALRNTTAAQTFNLYGTYTDASNYRRLRQTMTTGGAVTIAAEGLGTGATGNVIECSVDGASSLRVTSNGFYAQSGHQIGWLSRSRLLSPADGIIGLYNLAQSDFTRLQFGGTTSSFPALKRSTTTIQAVLADDSGFTFIRGKLQTDNNYAAGAVVPTGTVVIYDGTGTAYRVPCLV